MRLNTKAVLTIIVAFLSLSVSNIAAPETGSDEKDIWKDTVWHQWGQSNPDWIEPITPFRIIGNIYYIGTQGIGSYLIQSEQGHIVLDGGLPQNAEQIAANIVSLGFKLGDVKHLINSHAHFDHSGGLNQLKQLTGAKLTASKQDAVWLENGEYPGSENRDYMSVPVAVDRIIGSEEKLKLGSSELTAHLTPGHSPGCTSWRTEVMQDQINYSVVFFCGASVAANRLFPKPQHPGIIEDYRATFATIKDWQIDVYLSNHPFYLNLNKKRAAQLSGDPLAFVDSTEFNLAVTGMQADFEKKLAKQKQNAKLAVTK